MTSDIVFSLMLSQLSELIPHNKSVTSKTLPKPLSAVPCIIESIRFGKLVDCYEFSGIGAAAGTTNTSEVSYV